MTLSASAPGKVMVAGEYAVLCGHPALVMAANRRVQVHLEPAAEWMLSSDGGQPEAVRAAELSPAADPPHSPVARAVWSCCTELGIRPAPLRIRIDSTELQEAGAKLGLGSSAGVAVALAAALAQHERYEDVTLETYFRVHDRLQGTPGSGFDVAAALRGGWFEFCRVPGGAEIRVVPAPRVSLRFIWTGTVARTTGFVSRFRAWHDQAADSEAIVGALGAAAAAAITAVKAGDDAGFIAALKDNADHLSELATAAGLPIFAGGHAQLLALGKQMGVAYKPCGAGGGDIGLAAAEDDSRLDAFAAAARNEGYPPLQLECDPYGVKVERQETGF